MQDRTLIDPLSLDVSDMLDTSESTMSESELLSAVRQEVSNAEDEAIEWDVDQALDYYDAILPGVLADEDEAGNAYSSYVSPEVQNSVEATLENILPGFYGDAPVAFNAQNPNDEKQALDETRIVNYVFLTTNKGYSVLNRAFKDALICNVGVAAIYWDSAVQTKGQRVHGVPLEVALSLGDSLGGAEQDEQGTYTVDLIERDPTGKPVVEWVPCDQLMVNPDHQDVCLDNARFVARRQQISASDLVASGVPKDKVDSLGYSDSDLDAFGRRTIASDTESADESTRQITLVEAFYRVDVDGDGIAELRRVVTAGGNGTDTLLWQEPWDEQPFATGIATYAPRGWRGVSMTDRIKPVQDYKSDVMRQILDVGWRNLLQRVGVVERQVNMDDLRHSVRGGYIRMREQGSIFPFPEASLPPQIFDVLSNLDKQRRESGGGGIDNAAQAQEIGADSAHGVERIMSSVEASDAMVAKNLAETLVSAIYQKLHKILRKHWNWPLHARDQGSWIEQTPSQWHERNDLSVSVGLSQGTRTRQASALGAVIAQQSQDAQNGLDGLLVDLPNLYHARSDQARLAGIPHPEKYWLDPESPEGQQKAQQKAQQGQQQAQQQMQMQMQQQQAQQKFLLEIQRLQEETKIMVASMRDATDQQKQQFDQMDKITGHKIDLVELNAKYDAEPVPDQLVP